MPVKAPLDDLATVGSYRWRDVWPRRGNRSLPPGQRVVTVMPRFSSRPRVAPPAVPVRPQLKITGDVATPLRLDLDRLHQIPRTEIIAGFHCVTTWTIPKLTWAGWRFADVWQQVIKPDAAPVLDVTHIRVRGADGYWAVLDLEDALESEVMLADSLQGRPLDALHGAPLRLVSPRQYGYKSVKHIVGISVHNKAPRRYGGVIEHPRARVALEERHTTVAGRLLRWPYRALIIPVAAMAQHGASKQS